MITNDRTSETSDLYLSFVARPLNTLRIAVCRNGIQWLVQTRDGTWNGATRWKTRAYALTRLGLTKALRRFPSLSERDAKDVVRALPPRQSFEIADQPK